METHRTDTPRPPHADRNPRPTPGRAVGTPDERARRRARLTAIRDLTNRVTSRIDTIRGHSDDLDRIVDHARSLHHAGDISARDHAVVDANAVRDNIVSIADEVKALAVPQPPTASQPVLIETPSDYVMGYIQVAEGYVQQATDKLDQLLTDITDTRTTDDDGPATDTPPTPRHGDAPPHGTHHRGPLPSDDAPGPDRGHTRPHTPSPATPSPTGDRHTTPHHTKPEPTPTGTPPPPSTLTGPPHPTGDTKGPRPRPRRATVLLDPLPHPPHRTPPPPEHPPMATPSGPISGPPPAPRPTPHRGTTRHPAVMDPPPSQPAAPPRPSPALLAARIQHACALATLAAVTKANGAPHPGPRPRPRTTTGGPPPPPLMRQPGNPPRTDHPNPGQHRQRWHHNATTDLHTDPALPTDHFGDILRGIAPFVGRGTPAWVATHPHTIVIKQRIDTVIDHQRGTHIQEDAVRAAIDLLHRALTITAQPLPEHGTTAIPLAGPQRQAILDGLRDTHITTFLVPTTATHIVTATPRSRTGWAGPVAHVLHRLAHHALYTKGAVMETYTERNVSIQAAIRDALTQDDHLDVPAAIARAEAENLPLDEALYLQAHQQQGTPRFTRLREQAEERIAACRHAPHTTFVRRRVSRDSLTVHGLELLSGANPGPPSHPRPTTVGPTRRRTTPHAGTHGHLTPATPPNTLPLPGGPPTTARPVTGPDTPTHPPPPRTHNTVVVHKPAVRPATVVVKRPAQKPAQPPPPSQTHPPTGRHPTATDKSAPPSAAAGAGNPPARPTHDDAAPHAVPPPTPRPAAAPKPSTRPRPTRPRPTTTKVRITRANTAGAKPRISNDGEAILEALARLVSVLRDMTPATPEQRHHTERPPGTDSPDTAATLAAGRVRHAFIRLDTALNTEATAAARSVLARINSDAGYQGLATDVALWGRDTSPTRIDIDTLTRHLTTVINALLRNPTSALHTHLAPAIQRVHDRRTTDWPDDVAHWARAGMTHANPGTHLTPDLNHLCDTIALAFDVLTRLNPGDLPTHVCWTSPRTTLPVSDDTGAGKFTADTWMRSYLPSMVDWLHTWGLRAGWPRACIKDPAWRAAELHRLLAADGLEPVFQYMEGVLAEPPPVHLDTTPDDHNAMQRLHAALTLTLPHYKGTSPWREQEHTEGWAHGVAYRRLRTVTTTVTMTLSDNCVLNAAGALLVPPAHRPPPVSHGIPPMWGTVHGAQAPLLASPVWQHYGLITYMHAPKDTLLHLYTTLRVTPLEDRDIPTAARQGAPAGHMAQVLHRSTAVHGEGVTASPGRPHSRRRA